MPSFLKIQPHRLDMAGRCAGAWQRLRVTLVSTAPCARMRSHAVLTCDLRPPQANFPPIRGLPYKQSEQKYKKNKRWIQSGFSLSLRHVLVKCVTGCTGSPRFISAGGSIGTLSSRMKKLFDRRARREKNEKNMTTRGISGYPKRRPISYLGVHEDAHRPVFLQMKETCVILRTILILGK